MRLIEEIQRRLEEGWAVVFYLDDQSYLKVFPLDKIDLLYQEPANGFFMVEFGKDSRIEKVAKKLGIKVESPEHIVLIPLHKIEGIKFFPPPNIETFEDLKDFVVNRRHNTYREIGWALYNAGFEVGLDEGSDT